MKTTAEKIAVMQAHEDGFPIEVRKNFGNMDKLWRTPDADPSWDWNGCDYRVVVTKPIIDWSQVSEWLVAMATDESGETFLYTSIPNIVMDEWHGGCDFVQAIAFTSFKSGTCDWEDSLVIRPGHEE